MREKLGVCQWFHYEDFPGMERAIDELRTLGVRHLRTGISWADFHRPRGRAWYDWQMEALADFDVLLSVWHTPPSIAEGAVCAGPPKRLRDYADFVWQVIDAYGERFSHLELWNEPNNRYKWAFDRFDPDWRKFGTMIDMAARTARMQGKPTVLGGMIPVDPQWLELVKGHGALQDVDVVAIHGFPEMWWHGSINWEWQRDWSGWGDKIDSIEPSAEGRPIWITETGLATLDFESGESGRFDLQATLLERAAAAPVPRVYWYSLIDLDPAREAIEGFHVDENEYHMGLVSFDGERKPAWHRLRELLAE
jgi:CDP-paratose 2-epimerase